MIKFSLIKFIPLFAFLALFTSYISAAGKTTNASDYANCRTPVIGYPNIWKKHPMNAADVIGGTEVVYMSDKPFANTSSNGYKDIIQGVPILDTKEKASSYINYVMRSYGAHVNWKHTGELTAIFDNTTNSRLRFITGTTDHVKSGTDCDEALIYHISQVLIKHPEYIALTIRSYTELDGWTGNQKLSENRSSFIKNELIEAGAPSYWIASKGYGENDNRRSEELNRRTELYFWFAFPDLPNDL